jgi:hypothetical protein
MKRILSNLSAAAVVLLLVFAAAAPFLPEDKPSASDLFVHQAASCLADALIPSSQAATIGPVDAFTPAFGGRCTLQTGVPVMTTSATSATTTYYTPYPGSPAANRVVIWNGTKLVNWVFAELSNVTTATATGSAGPAAVAANSVYDLYVWACTSTSLCLTRSPAWTSGTSRGTGAGTAELDCTTVPGICTNKVAITNGPAANRGTFVCTEASDAGSTIDWQYGGLAANWGQAIHNLWNMYNRVLVGGFLGDTTNSWTYQSATIRASNGNATARVTAVFGRDEDITVITGLMRAQAATNTTNAIFGIGLDTTTAYSQSIVWIPTAQTAVAAIPIFGSYLYTGNAGLGSHFFSANESAQNATAAVTFYGDNGVALQTGMNYQIRM